MKQLLILTALILLTPEALAQQWPTFRRDPARSGMVSESLDASRLELAWEWQSDEPAGNLDAKNSQPTFRVLREFYDASGGVRVTTHDPGGKLWADEILELESGRLKSVVTKR